MSKIFGLALIIVSVYFLGQNIVFVTHHYHNSWQRISSAISIISLMLGIGCLTFWRSVVGNLGWVFIIIGIILVYISSGVVLRPTNLWTVLLEMSILAIGFQLVTGGKIKI